MALIDDALASSCLVLSSAGAHAKQKWQAIIDRKCHDIVNTGHTVWVINSLAAIPNIVQAACQQHGARHVVFLARIRDKPGVNTSNDSEASYYSADNHTWKTLHYGLSEVTGLINRATTGLWFDRLEQIDSGKLSLAAFVKTNDGQGLSGFSNISSAYPVWRVTPARLEHDGTYHVLAVGQLASPFAVWLRKCTT